MICKFGDNSITSEAWRVLKTPNQNQTAFHRTFRATVTSEKLIDAYNRLGQWQKVAKEFNVSHAYIIQARKWTGVFVPTLTRGKSYGGAMSKYYKGKYADKRGYVRVNRFHPENTKGYVAYEHVLVMENHLGRNLLPGESIHHIDGNKSNNKIENLYLCNHSTHRKAENSCCDIVYQLYKSGKVIFDSKLGIYIINKG